MEYSRLYHKWERNIFVIDIGRYTNEARTQKDNFKKAKSIWDEASQMIIPA